MAGPGPTDLLADHTAPPQNLPRWEPENDHTATVFAQLTPNEQDLARTWATTAPGTTWPEFAGIPDTDADHLRRKLRRLGHQHQQRRGAPSVPGPWTDTGAGAPRPGRKGRCRAPHGRGRATTRASMPGHILRGGQAGTHSLLAGGAREMPQDFLAAQLAL